MAGEIAGQDFLLHTSADGTTYALIASCTSHKMSVNNEPVDVTSKDSVWQTLLDGKGKKNVSIDFTGFVSSDTDYTSLETKAFDGTSSQIFCRLVFGNGKKIEGKFHIANFSLDGTDKQGVTFACTLASAGIVPLASVS